MDLQEEKPDAEFLVGEAMRGDGIPFGRMGRKADPRSILLASVSYPILRRTS